MSKILVKKTGEIFEYTSIVHSITVGFNKETLEFTSIKDSDDPVYTYHTTIGKKYTLRDSEVVKGIRKIRDYKIQNTLENLK